MSSSVADAYYLITAGLCLLLALRLLRRAIAPGGVLVQAATAAALAALAIVGALVLLTVTALISR